MKKMVGVAVIGALGLSALAWATSNGGVIEACVGPFGTLRLTDHGSCGRHERVIRWNVSGPQGIAGPAGAPGPTGPQGPAGPAGSGGGGAPIPNQRLTGRATLDGVPSVLEVSSYRLAASNPGAIGGGGGGGGGSGKVSFDSVYVTTPTEGARPALLKLVAEGVHVSSAVLELLDRTGTSVVATYALEDVLVSGDSAYDEGLGEGRALQTVNLSFSRITVTAGGAAYCWDLRQNRRC